MANVAARQQSTGEALERATLLSIKAGVALVFLSPLIVMSDPLPNTFFPFIVGKALYARTLTEIVFGMWLVLALRNPAYRIPQTWLIGLLGVYVVVTLLASIFGVSLQRSLWSTYERMQGFVDLAHWFAFTVVLTSVFRSWVDWRALLNFSLAISLVMVLMGLVQRFRLICVPKSAPQQPDCLIDGFIYLDAVQRLEITLGNPTYVGAYMLVSILIASAFVAHSFFAKDTPVVSTTTERRRRRTRRRGAGAGAEGQTSEGPWALYWAAAIAIVLVTLFLVGRGNVSDPNRDVEVPRLVFFVLLLLTGGFGASYFLWPQPKRAWWRIFWGTVIVLAFILMYESGTRGAFLGLAGGMLAFGTAYAIWGRIPRLRTVSIVMIAVTIGSMVLVISSRNTPWFESLARSNVMLSRISTLGESNDSLSGRVGSVRTGIRGFAERPLLGWGPENFAVAYDRLVTPEIVAQAVTSFDQAHSKPVEELATKGILGLLSYMALWLYVLWVMIRKTKAMDPEDQLFAMLVGAALAGYFAQNLFLFDTPGTVPHFYLLLGFAVFIDTAIRESDPDRRASRDEKSSESRFRLEYPRMLRGDGAFVGAMIVAGLLVVFSLYFTTYRPYVAATTVLSAFRGDIPWSERLDLYEESISAFPPLANYFRVAMFNRIALDWANMSDEEASAAIELASEEGVRAIETEPEEWRSYLALAVLYQQALPRLPGLLGEARFLVDEAVKLAPIRVEVNKLLVRQYIVEGDLDGAVQAIDAYLKLNPAGRPHFQAQRDTIVAAIEGQEPQSE